jgi:hypothetical protein
MFSFENPIGTALQKAAGKEKAFVEHFQMGWRL